MRFVTLSALFFDRLLGAGPMHKLDLGIHRPEWHPGSQPSVLKNSFIHTASVFMWDHPNPLPPGCPLTCMVTLLFGVDVMCNQKNFMH